MAVQKGSEIECMFSLIHWVLLLGLHEVYTINQTLFVVNLVLFTSF